MIADYTTKSKIVIFQSVSERQYAKWTKIVKFRPSQSTIFIFYPTLTQKQLEWFSPSFSHHEEQLVELLMRIFAQRRCIFFQNTSENSEYG